MLLNTGRNMDLFNGLRLIDGKTLQKPSKFLVRDGTNGFSIHGPLKFPVFQSLIKENKSISFPAECFHPITSPATKEKQTVLERVQLKVLLDNGRKSINRLSHVRVTTRNIDFLRFLDITEHFAVPLACFRLALRMQCFEFPILLPQHEAQYPMMILDPKSPF